MSEPFIGQVQTFAFNFAPRGWATCDGQMLQITQHTALFSLLGTIYGGDAQSSFALPDLRGRAVLHQGQGPGLTNRAIGQRFGNEQVTLGAANMPAHSHPLNAAAVDGTDVKPENNLLAAGTMIYSGAVADTVMSNQAIGSVGNTTPFGSMPPSIVINWCIALSGTYPSRN